MTSIKTWEMLNAHITNKDIAVVGNAQSLFGKGYGWLIDSNDVVFRFNAGALVTDSNSQGSRTDVAVMSPPYLWKEVINQLSKETTILHVTNKHRMAQEMYIQTPHKPNDQLKIDFYGSRPSSGALLINLLLSSQCNVNKIRLYGFDWKETPTYYNGNDVKNGAHNYQIERLWMKKLHKDGKIEIIG